MGFLSVKQKSETAKVKAETQTANEASERLVLHMQIRRGSLSITKTVSLLANEFDVPKRIALANELGSCQS